jgi:DedD protein
MEVALKQRLVGASVIIALAVIFIPMLFDNSSTNQNQSISINIPDEPENLQQKVINIDTGHFTTNPDTKKEPNAKDDPLIELQDESGTTNNPIINKEETILDVVDNSDTHNLNNEDIVIDLNDAENPVEMTSKSPGKEETTAPIQDEITAPVKDTNATDDTVENNNFRVKFGVFSLQKNAQELKAKIINSGYSAIVEKNRETNQYVVYSQQLATESEANELSNSIQKLNLKIGKPSIISLNEEESIAAEMMLDTGWIIQIGSFASKVNSIKLRDKIRDKGFVTFVDEIINSKQEKRYRVRVGPYATRDEALEQQLKIKNSMDLNGLIKPHEKQKVITQ